jgi:hypothetical protein
MKGGRELLFCHETGTNATQWMQWTIVGPGAVCQTDRLNFSKGVGQAALLDHDVYAADRTKLAPGCKAPAAAPPGWIGSGRDHRVNGMVRNSSCRVANRNSYWRHPGCYRAADPLAFGSTLKAQVGQERLLKVLKEAPEGNQ